MIYRMSIPRSAYDANRKTLAQLFSDLQQYSISYYDHCTINPLSERVVVFRYDFELDELDITQIKLRFVDEFNRWVKLVDDNTINNV
jgi:hypothetical protein